MINAIIVDDEPAVFPIIDHFIHKEHLPIQIVGNARNGQEAIALLHQHEVGLVFIDIHMPVMDGLKVIELEPDYDYIIITAYDEFEYAQQALRLGAKDILLKPIDQKQLVESINRVIGWRVTDNTTLNEILEYIHGHYPKELDLSTLSSIFFVSPSHISRLFKKHLSTNTVAYINEIRIRHAIEMLRAGSLSIKEIAEKTGYKNLNNFYKYFKQITGKTPASYLPADQKSPTAKGSGQ